MYASQAESLVFDFYAADTFEPHPDAARPSMVLHCPENLRLVMSPGHDDIHDCDIATIAISGDYIVFAVTDSWASQSQSDEGWVENHLYYCIQWRDGLLTPVGTIFIILGRKTLRLSSAPDRKVSYTLH